MTTGTIRINGNGSAAAAIAEKERAELAAAIAIVESPDYGFAVTPARRTASGARNTARTFVAPKGSALRSEKAGKVCFATVITDGRIIHWTATGKIALAYRLEADTEITATGWEVVA